MASNSLHIFFLSSSLVFRCALETKAGEVKDLISGAKDSKSKEKNMVTKQPHYLSKLRN
jgi:hypothetical protein